MGGNKLVVLSVVLVLAFIGCTLPPSPSSPGLSGEDSGLVGFAFRNLNFNEKSLEQFSPPIDPFDNDRVIFSIFDEIVIIEENEKEYVKHGIHDDNRMINKGWIECCEFFLRNFDITEKTITEERER